jgi:hypothetical protein
MTRRPQQQKKRTKKKKRTIKTKEQKKIRLKVKVSPLSQVSRVPCSLPLVDAQPYAGKGGNANWLNGLQSMSDWIWSGNLNKDRFPNNLGRFFLWIPGAFEQQLNYSTTLIFDEPSFRNGVQMSGMLDRVSRELAISLIAHKRRCWYSMTHHAVLGKLTAKKQGLTDQQFIDKWVNVGEFDKRPEVYTKLELAILSFANSFCTNPKKYTDNQFQQLRSALQEDNRRRYAAEILWLDRLKAARSARAKALVEGRSQEDIERIARRAADDVSVVMPEELNERMINGQVIELAFLCLQFVALTDVLTVLNIPDEDFFADLMSKIVPSPVIERINEFNLLGSKGMDDLVPPKVIPPVQAVSVGKLVVKPAQLKGSRVPLISYEQKTDLDKGITVGGVQTGVYGWSFGTHLPGSLAYCLMHHPELARYEPPYSLPVLFNEDEWRNGVNTSGFVTRRLKEIIIQKIYRILRTRYGIEHHTMYSYNVFLDEFGIGRSPSEQLTEQERETARKMALEKANAVCLWIHDHERAPDETYTPLERAALSWTAAILERPHHAYKLEKTLRKELNNENRREIAAGTRRLDTSRDKTEKQSLDRLVNHQIAELAMMIGHMDGLGRVLTILRLESEDSVQILEGKIGPDGGIIPDLDSSGQVKLTGYFNNRPSFFDILQQVGVQDSILTLNELMVNPKLNEGVQKRLAKEKEVVSISQDISSKTGEF